MTKFDTSRPTAVMFNCHIPIITETNSIFRIPMDVMESQHENVITNKCLLTVKADNRISIPLAPHLLSDEPHVDSGHFYRL